MANTFIVGADLFAFADTNWNLINRSFAKQRGTNVGTDGSGEFVVPTDIAWDTQNDVTCEYEAKVVTTGLSVAISLGLAAASGYTPTQVKITTTGGDGPKNAKVSITGHKHGSSDTHAVNSADVTCTVDGFGATDFCSATPDNGCQSSSWTATINHKDGRDKLGAWLCGRSQGCKIEVAGEYLSDAAPALGTDWTDDGSSSKDGGVFWTASLKGHKYQAAA